MPNIDLTTQAAPTSWTGKFGKTTVQITRSAGFIIGAIQDAPPGVFGSASLYPADGSEEPILLTFDPPVRAFGTSSTGRGVATQPRVLGFFGPNPHGSRTISDLTAEPMAAPDFDNQALQPAFNLLIERVELSAVGPRTEAWDKLFFQE